MRGALLLTVLSVAPAFAAEPFLTFMSGDREVARIAAWDLRSRKDARVITIPDPFYGRIKRYRAIPLRNLLTNAYGPSWLEDGVGEMFFEALDGYQSHAKVPVLSAEGAMIAFEDVDVPDWEPMPKDKVIPGPFYLVWTGPDQTPAKGFPWPWQIARVRSAIVEDLFPKAVPRNYPLKSRAPAGWAIFRSRCISCHAMNGHGGTVGPDLNEPRGITRYHDKGELKDFIYRASDFRHTKMPDFIDLTPKNLSDLITYFDFMAIQAGTK